MYSSYYAEACDEWRGPFPPLSAWSTQLRRNVVMMASRWRHCVDLTGPRIEPQTSRTDSLVGLVLAFHQSIYPLSQKVEMLGGLNSNSCPRYPSGISGSKKKVLHNCDTHYYTVECERGFIISFKFNNAASCSVAY